MILYIESDPMTIRIFLLLSTGIAFRQKTNNIQSKRPKSLDKKSSYMPIYASSEYQFEKLDLKQELFNKPHFEDSNWDKINLPNSFEKRFNMPRVQAMVWFRRNKKKCYIV